MPRPTRLAVAPLEDRLAPAAGDLDPTFGDAGRVALPDPGWPSAVAAAPDGRVVVAVQDLAGSSWTYRLLPDGAIDPSFGAGGKSASVPGYVKAVAALPDGRVLLAGSTAPDRASTADFLAARLTADGQLDPAFGTGGLVAVPFDAGDVRADAANALAALPDGRVVLAGSSRTFVPPPPLITTSELFTGTGAFAAARLTADGKLDPTFGDGGRASVLVPLNGYNDAAARAVAVQPDGTVVLAGSAVSDSALYFFGVHFPFSRRYFSDLAAVRLTAGGTPDPSFGTGGRTTVAFALADFTTAAALAAAVLPDGRVLLAGTAQGVTGPPPGLVAEGELLAVAVRLTSGGQPDRTYDGNGKLELPGFNPVSAVAAADGRVVFAGTRVAQLTVGGKPDPAFGTGGSVPTPFLDPADGIPFSPVGLALQPDGQILLAGRRQSEALVGRLEGTGPARPLTPTQGATQAGGPEDGTAVTLNAAGGSVFPAAATDFFPGFAGSVRPATADVTGDGVPDLVGGSGPGGGPRVRVLDPLSDRVVADDFAFDPALTGGVFVG